MTNDLVKLIMSIINLCFIFIAELPTLPYGVEKSPNSLLRLTAVITKHLQNAKQKYKHFLLEYLVSFCLIGIFVYYCESYLTSRPSKISRELGFGTYPDQPVPVRLIPDPHRDESVSIYMHTGRAFYCKALYVRYTQIL